jgi:zinc protease
MKSFVKGGLVIALIIALPLIYFGAKKIKTEIEVSHIQSTHGIFEVHHWISPEGTKVAFTPLKELPILDIHLVFAAGSAYDGEKFGIAQLTQQLIGEDTADLTGDAIHEAFESVGAQFNTGVGQDSLNISLRTLTQSDLLKHAVSTLETILQKTTFTQPSFDREKQSLLTTIMSNKQDPRTTIGQAFYAAMYGQHPYAHPVSGTSDTVNTITLQDIQAFHKAYLVKENAVIAIAGDISLEEAKELADQLIAALPSGKTAPVIPPIPEIAHHEESVIFPSSQTHLMMGIPAVAKGNPDFYALTVGNQILGVMPLVNRLFDAVREKQGLAYNVGSSVTTLKQPGPFTIYLQSRASEADKANNLVHDTLNKYLQEGPTETELQDAKENLYGQFVMGLSNNAAIAAHLATLAFYDLPWDYQDHFQENINKVTLEDIKTVFARYIKPNEFTTIRLGAS